MIRNNSIVNTLNQSHGTVPSLAISLSVVYAAWGSNSTSRTITVATEEQEWDYEIDCSWLTVTGASGEGTDSFLISWTANTGDERIGIITFTSDYCKSVFVTVTQAASYL